MKNREEIMEKVTKRLTDFDCEIAASIAILTSLVTNMVSDKPLVGLDVNINNERIEWIRTRNKAMKNLSDRLELIEEALKVESTLREQELYSADLNLEQAKANLDLEQDKWLDDGGNPHV